MSALDELLRPIRFLLVGGARQSQEQSLDLIAGAGMSVTPVDDPANGVMHVTLASASVPYGAYSLDCTAGGTVVYATAPGAPAVPPSAGVRLTGTPGSAFAVTMPAGSYATTVINDTIKQCAVNGVALVEAGASVQFVSSAALGIEPVEWIGANAVSDVQLTFGDSGGIVRQVVSVAGQNQASPGSQTTVPVYGAGLFQLDAESNGVTPPVAGTPTGQNGSGRYYVAPSFPGLTSLTDGGQQVDPSGNVVADCPALASPNAARNTQALQSAVGKSWVDTLVGPSASNVVAFSIPPGITSARVLLQARVTATDGITETAGDVYAGETLLSWVNGFGGAVSVVPVKAGGDSVLSENALPASGSISGMTLAASTDTFNAWLSYATAGTLDPSTNVDVDVTILFARTC